MNLSAHHSIKINGEDREIFMSYGLLHVLCVLVNNDPANAILLQLSEDLQREALRELLTERKPSGKAIKEFTEDDLDDTVVDPDDIVELVGWAMQHVINFMLKRAEKVDLVGEQAKPRLEALAQKAQPSSSAG